MITLTREDGYYFINESDGHKWVLQTLDEAITWIQWLIDNPRNV